MISQVKVKNFKALGEPAPVRLTPFTVLVGPNDTGKTSFLEAIYALAESTSRPLADCFWSPWERLQLVHNQNSDANVEFDADLESLPCGNDKRANAKDRLHYYLSLTFLAQAERNCQACCERISEYDLTGNVAEMNSKSQSRTAVCSYQAGAGFPPDQQTLLKRVLNSLSQSALARWDVEELGMPSHLNADRRLPFDPSGYGLATCIAEMKLGKGGHFDALKTAFCGLFTDFDDILVRRTSVQGFTRDERFRKQQTKIGEGYAISLLRKDGIEVPAGLASGGILVTLGYLTLVNLENPRKLLLIEEPENALHPGRIKEIIDVLRQATQPPTNCQIVMTTHSPLLLDYFEPEEVRIFLRNEQNDIEIHNLADVPEIRDRLNYLMLGELVYNEGEQELVKEIRQHVGVHSG